MTRGPAVVRDPEVGDRWAPERIGIRLCGTTFLRIELGSCGRLRLSGTSVSVTGETPLQSCQCGEERQTLAKRVKGAHIKDRKAL